MVLTFVLGILAVLSWSLTLWQWAVAFRFPLHHRDGGNPDDQRAVAGGVPAVPTAVRAEFHAGRHPVEASETSCGYGDLPTNVGGAFQFGPVPAADTLLD